MLSMEERNAILRETIARTNALIARLKGETAKLQSKASETSQETR